MNNHNQENVRTAYQVAVDFVRSEEQGIWARFNAMLVANSIIVAFIGQIFNKSKELVFLSSLFGLFLCFMWFFLIKRGFNYREYFVLSAREFEVYNPDQYNPDRFQILSRGERFSKGESIPFHFSGAIQDESLKMRFHQIKPESIAYLVIFAFIILYLYLIFGPSIELLIGTLIGIIGYWLSVNCGNLRYCRKKPI